jgi:CO/xanthine dehydrogenase FAD-binding subunit
MNAIQHYLAPTTLADALDCLQDGEVTVLAGGTDLMPQSASGKLQFKPTLMNIRRVPELAGVVRDGDAVRVGALVTVTELMHDPIVRELFPVLVEAGDHFASDQIRNAATIGGNVNNASPAGDMLVPLLVLGAEAELATKPNGSIATRRVPLAEFFVSPGRTRRAPHELLTGVRIPVPPRGHRARFYKFGTRPALDISAISIGIAAVSAGGVLTDVRVAFGAVAPTPVRAPHTEAALEGKRLDRATIDAAAQAAHDEVKPIDDVRASAWYRRELIRNMTRRMLDDVAQA